MTITKETKENLEKLITANEDASKGYAKASEGIDNPEIKSFMTTQASKRNEFAASLRRFHPEPDSDRGSFTGEIHRGWMNMKNSMNVSDEEIVKECVFGENKATEQYEEAIKSDDLNPELRSTFQSQISEIRSAKDWLENRNN